MVKKLNIAVIHTRLFCIDGVSLEALKWIKAYEKLGHKIFLIAGLYGEKVKYPKLEVPEIDYAEEKIKEINDLAFKQDLEPKDKEKLMQKIRKMADFLKPKIKKFLIDNKINMLSVENVLSIPMNLPLGVALKEILEELKLPAICRHHDFAWERDVYTVHNNVPEIIDECFPPDLPHLKHITINKLGHDSLEETKGMHSEVFYNAFDFDDIQEENEDTKGFRKYMNIKKKELLFLQPTRIIRRKKIERSLELAAEMQKRLNKPCVVLVTGTTLYYSSHYFDELQNFANELSVRIVFGRNRLELERTCNEDVRSHTIDDAYINADMVCFPSSLEGFGDPVIEACMYKKPLFTNKYPVMEEILVHGFDFVLMEGDLTEEVFDKAEKALTDKEFRNKMVEHNFRIAKEDFSIKDLVEKLKRYIEECSC